MKDFTAAQTIAKNKTAQQPLYLLQFDFSGGTQYIATREDDTHWNTYAGPDGNVYSTMISRLGKLADKHEVSLQGSQGTPTVPIKIINKKGVLAAGQQFSDYLTDPENTEVRVYQFFHNESLAADDMALIFQATIQGPIEYDELYCSFTLLSFEYKKGNVTVGAVLDKATHPNAKKTDLGKPVPYLFGDFTSKYVPGLVSQKGAQCKLAADISDVATSLTLQNDVETGLLPGSDFVLFVRDEQVHVTTRSGGSCTGLTREYNGTAKAAHYKGDVATEKKEWRVVFSRGRLKNTGTGLFAKDMEGNYIPILNPVTMVSGNPSYARLTDQQMPYYEEKPKEQQLDRGDHQHNIDGQSIEILQADLMCDDISFTCNGTANDVERIVDKIMYDAATFDGYTGSGLLIKLYHRTISGEGVLKKIKIKIKSSYTGPGSISLRIRQYINGGLEYSGTFNVSSVGVYESAWIDVSAYDFSDLTGNNSYIEIFDENISGAEVLSVYEGWHTSEAERKIDDHELDATDVETQTVRRYTDTVYLKSPQGEYDDDAGTYTGAAGALIKRASDVALFFIMDSKFGGYASSLIDSTTLNAFRALCDTNSLYFQAIVDRQWRLMDLLGFMGKQSRTLIKWEVDKWKFHWLPDFTEAGSGYVKSLSDQDIHGVLVKCTRTDISRIINDIVLYFDKDWTASGGEEAFRDQYEVSDSSSIAKHGKKSQPGSFYFPWINSESVAEMLGVFYLHEFKDIQRHYGTEFFLTESELEIADEIRWTGCLDNLNNQGCQIIGVTKGFGQLASSFPLIKLTFRPFA